MKCPACKSKIPYCKICPYCKKNVIMAKKIVALSNAFYNKALAQVKNHELFIAVINLKKSLALNKANTHARNLLGLIFYRMGKMSEALKHWVISTSFEKCDNPANNYLLISQQNLKILDKYNDAIKFYNLGLSYINQNNDDMGVMQLKKSLELNPDFLEASNLLALCYIYQDEKAKAKKILEHVLEIDNENPVARRYYKEVFGKMVLDAKSNSVSSKHKFIELFNFSGIAIFLSGIFFGITAIYILIYPAQIDSKNKLISRLEKELDTLKQNHDTINMKYNNELPKLKRENEQLTKNNIEFQQRILEEETKEKLEQVQDLYKEKKFLQAADILDNLNTEQTDSLSTQALNLKNEIYPHTAKLYYEKGLKLYKNENYAAAKENFEKALLFSNGSIDAKINYYLEEINSQ